MYVNKKIQMLIESEIKSVFVFMQTEFDQINKNFKTLQKKVSNESLYSMIDKRVNKKMEVNRISSQLKNISEGMDKIASVVKATQDPFKIPPLNYSFKDWLGMKAESLCEAGEDPKDKFNIGSLSIIPKDSGHAWRWSDTHNNVEHVFCKDCDFIPDENSSPDQLMICDKGMSDEQKSSWLQDKEQK